MFWVEDFTMFFIKLHYDGRFTKLQNIKYLYAEVRFIDLLDVNKFFMHEMDLINNV